MKYLLILILLLSVLRAQDDQPDQPDQPKVNLLKLDENITLNLKPNTSIIYELQELDLKQGKIWNLFFVAEPVKGQQWTDLDLHLSLKNGKGNLTKFVSCEDIGVDSCLIPASRLRLDDIIAVQFKCKQKTQNCNYTFKSYWSENFPININRRLRIDFEQQAYAQIFSLDLSKEQFKQVRILLRAESFLVGTAPIKMVANYGTKNAPEFNNFEIGSTHLWDDGQGIFLQRVNMTSLNLLILVQGPAENVLLLDVFLVNQENNQLTLQSPVYDYLRNENQRSYFLNINEKSVKDDDIIIKVSTFSGRLNISFYKDANLTKQILGGQFSHHGELQYRFTRRHLNNQRLQDNLYILITSPLYDSTFVINAYGRNDTMIKLSNDIEEMAELQSGQIMNYYVDAFLKTNHTQGKQLKFSLHNVIGNIRAYFSICNQNDVQQCSVSFKTFNSFKDRYDTLTPVQIQETGSSTIYRVHIPLQKFVKKTQNTDFKKVTVLILFASDDGDTKRFTLRYIDQRIKILRDNHPLKDRLIQGQKRVYRIVEIEKDVQYAAIHLIQISGSTRMVGYNKNPITENISLSQSIISIRNQIIYYPQDKDSKRTRKDPLYIVVLGQDNSLYSISLTFYRKASINPSPIQGDNFNYMTVPSDVEQQLTIQPSAILVIKIQPNNRDYNFIYSSSYPLEFCVRNNAKKLPNDPNCDFKILTNEYKLPNVTSLFIGIKNINNKTATVKVKYSKNQNQKCDLQKLGKVWRANIQIDRCITYKVSKNNPIEFMISLNKLQSKSGKYYTQINNKSINFNTHHFLITKELLIEECQKTIECQISLFFVNLPGAQIQVIAQTTGKQLILLDGLAQDVFSVSSPNVPKYFKYYLVNKQNTTFFVESKKGYFEFYVNIKDSFDEDLKTNITKFPSKKQFMFESESSRYTIYSQLTINQQNITKANCTSCVAYITVVGSKDQYRQQGHFVIQVSQEVRTLKEHQSAIGFLAKQSFAYYQYYFPNEKGTLIISLTTQKTKCGTIYLSQGTLQKASGSNYMNKTYSGQLIVDVQKGAYSITVEAVEMDCQYVISASASDFKLFELKPGVYQDIKFEQKGQINYFLYNHFSSTPFKVMSIQQYGQVMISAKQVQQNQLQNISKNNTNKSSFNIKQTKDILYINPKDYSDSSLQQSTYYLIAIESTKPTMTSILIYNGQVQIPLSNQNAITDISNRNDVMVYKIYAGDSKQLNISLNIHYGMIQVTVVEANQSKMFNTSNKIQEWQLSLKREIIYRPLIVKVQILKDSMYEIKLRYNQSSKSDTMMKHGLPTYIFLDKKQSKCAYGDLAENDQKLIVSVYKTQKNKLEKLIINTKVANKTAKTQTQTVQNTMIISLSDKYDKSLFNNDTLIEYCFENTQQYISLTLIPSSTITFLPESTLLPVRNQENFTIYPSGKFWIQILECQGTTSLLLSRQFSKVGSSQSEVLHWRTFGDNYLLQVVDHYGLAYMNVEGKHSLVRWKHINQNTGQGAGYYAIRLPHYSYHIKNSVLTFKIPPVIKLNRMNIDFLTFKPNYGFFYMIVSPSLKQLKRSVQCSLGKSYVLSKQFTNLDWKTEFNFDYQIQRLKGLFPNQNFIYAGGALQLYVKMNDTETQTYRFMMSSQRIPLNGAEYDTQDQESQIQNPIIDNLAKSGSLLWIIFLLVAVIILVCVCRFFYRRYKLKRALLANQNSGALEMRYSEYSVN